MKVWLLLFVLLLTCSCVSVVHGPSGLQAKRYGLRSEVTITESKEIVAILNGSPVVRETSTINVTGGVPADAYTAVIEQLRQALTPQRALTIP